MINPKQRVYPRSSSDEPPAGGSHALILDFVGSSKRVLEFGCSNGYMSRFLAKRNCVVTGLELDPHAAAEARAFCEEVIVADLDTRPLVDLLPGTPFDVAVFGDVLEHLRDPWRVLDEARSFLGPGSFAVISLPNVAHGSVRLSLLQGSFNYADQGLLDSTHLRFFTLRSLRELCLRAGYRIEEVRRTKLDIFLQSDLLPEVREADFDPDLVAEIRRDPDSDTVQFVVKATPLQEREKFLVAVSDLMDSEKKLERSLEDLGKRDLEIAQLRRELDELQQSNKTAVADLEASEAIALERLAAAESSFRMDLATLQEEKDRIESELVGIDGAFRAELAALTLAYQTEMSDRSAAETALRSALESEISKRDGQLAATLRDHSASVERLRAEAAAEVRKGEDEMARVRLNAETLRTECQEVRAMLAEAQSGKVALEAELQLRTSELLSTHERLRATLSERDALMQIALERAQMETQLVRHEVAATDALIREVYRSNWWLLKRLVTRLRLLKKRIIG